MGTQEKVVLVIEDDAETIVLLRLMLRQRKLKVVTLPSSDGLMAAIESLNPDLVLLDLMMPGMDGWEIYQQMKASPTLREIPIIVITVRSRETARLEGQHFEAIAGYVRKPFHPGSFLKLVDRCLSSPSSRTPLAIQ